jgi:hypothetical protein
MKKIRLNIDDLKVQSFATTSAASLGVDGTVQAFSESTGAGPCIQYPSDYNPAQCAQTGIQTAAFCTCATCMYPC